MSEKNSTSQRKKQNKNQTDINLLGGDLRLWIVLIQEFTCFDRVKTYVLYSHMYQQSHCIITVNMFCWSTNCVPRELDCWDGYGSMYQNDASSFERNVGQCFWLSVCSDNMWSVVGFGKQIIVISFLRVHITLLLCVCVCFMFIGEMVGV